MAMTNQNITQRTLPMAGPRKKTSIRKKLKLPTSSMISTGLMLMTR